MNHTKLSRNVFASFWLALPTLLFGIILTFSPYTVNNSAVWVLPTAILLLDIFVRGFEKEELPDLVFNRIKPGDQFAQGSPVRVVVEVRNVGAGTFRGEVIDLLPNTIVLISGNNRQMMVIPPKEVRSFSYEFHLDVRGQHKIGPLHYRYHSVNEYQEITNSSDLIDYFTIIPKAEEISKYPTIVRFLRSIGGPFPSKLTGEGWDFAGVREYNMQDSFRRINWKATARMSKLQTNEFEIPRSSKILIVLDLTEDLSNVLERSIQVSLGLSNFLLGSACSVGLITIGKYTTYIPASGNRKVIYNLANHLTNVEAGSIANRQVMINRINSVINKLRSDHEVIIFSSLADKFFNSLITDSLTKAGNVTVFTPDFIMHKLEREVSKNRPLLKIFTMMRQITIAELLGKGVSVKQWNPRLELKESIRRGG